MKIKEVIEVLESFAPPALAEEWDNVGLMLGDAGQDCNGILLALDLTSEIIGQAEESGCNLIVTHHPFIFHALRNVDFSEAKGRAVARLIKSGICVYSMHTNLDKADGGINCELCNILGGRLVNNDGLGALLEIKPVRLADFAKLVAEKLGDRSVKIAGNPDKTVGRVYVVGGSGGSEYERARQCADVLLTGDLKHHNYIEAAEDGFALVEFSHFASEVIATDILTKALESTGVKTIKAKQNSPFRLLEEI